MDALFIVQYFRYVNGRTQLAAKNGSEYNFINIYCQYELEQLALGTWKRSEVEDAWRHFVEVGDSGDWSKWADLHTEDGLWVEHHLGIFQGREAIREAIVRVMQPVVMMQFPVAWHAIDEGRVIYYPWQVFPDPKGGEEIYRFGCVTILDYAGNGLWSRQEDLYNPNEADEVVRRWLAAGGRFAQTPSEH